MKLSGKVALVTGGSRGIGAAIAKRLAREGAKVAITWSTNPDKATEVVGSIKAAGGHAIAIQADSANPADIRRAVASVVEQEGGLDILINNAGVATMVPVEEFQEADFDRLIAVNVKGVYVATQEALRHLKAGGRIINIGSINAEVVPFPGMAIYAMSKAAIATFTRGLAREVGARGITVNNIQPGPVNTDMNPADSDFAETLRGLMAVPRYGSAEEIAGLAAYLASDESAFVTGASWNIDGGFAL
ncbi:3-oxoacyl-ACP reductase family protein [Cellvibrio sp. PSBB006]|uniref:3-oxoacyl-ACP reductase family protein n=1 Tax=Cellvibrio sp. PSBB006 TaxID=1987723 RepID=UPI000B3B102E|nr:3-oxoacyl-ACP reductase family protein [Cellvibrio sp. PSBB006]ARU25966.1 oxidoreductase [Cellvibrio sp. PSBB006]